MPGKIKIIITSDASQLAETGAHLFCKTAKESIALQNRFAVAISGGSTPRAMHRLLSQEPYLSEVPWQKTHLFWVDERMVAVDHPDSNFGTAKKDFLNIIPIPSDQVYSIPVMTRPEEGVALYQATLKTFFHDMSNDNPVFDLILLGIGQDGHVASLFPGQPQIKEANRWVLHVKGGQPNVCRITLTYHVLNNARQILFLVSGSGKAAIVKILLKNGQAQLPAGKIRPPHGSVIWLLDQAAASLLYRLSGVIHSSHEK